MEIERALTGGVLLQKIGDYRIDNRTFATVQQLDLLRNDVKGVNLVMLGKQQCDGQSNVAGACNRDFHNQSAFPCAILSYCKCKSLGQIDEAGILQVILADAHIVLDEPIVMKQLLRLL